MIVVAILGILAGITVAYTGEPRATVRGFAEAIAGEADTARLRAISSRRWHRVRFDFESRRVVTEQALFTGMEEPADDEWALVGRFEIPVGIEVHSIAETANVVAGDGLPGEGDGLDLALGFAPDGSSVARTVYLQNTNGRNGYRIVVYRATGTAYVKDTW